MPARERMRPSRVPLCLVVVRGVDGVRSKKQVVKPVSTGRQPLTVLKLVLITLIRSLHSALGCSLQYATSNDRDGS